MESTLKVLSRHQLPSGQFPTTMVNLREGFQRIVSTITPTYLICLFLSLLRERRPSHHLLDQIVNKGLKFLERMSYRDTVEDIAVWHFNAFYAPDWEETCWCSFLLYQAGFLPKSILEPMKRLILTNETPEHGIGVWVKDDYSSENKYNNVFDPVVSLSVTNWLQRIFRITSEPTQVFIERALKHDLPSLYYDENFKKFLFYLFNRGKKPKSLQHQNHRLFHHGNRTQVWYTSSDVWEAANLLMA